MMVRRRAGAPEEWKVVRKGRGLYRIFARCSTRSEPDAQRMMCRTENWDKLVLAVVLICACVCGPINESEQSVCGRTFPHHFSEKQARSPTKRTSPPGGPAPVASGGYLVSVTCCSRKFRACDATAPATFARVTLWAATLYGSACLYARRAGTFGWESPHQVTM